MRPSDCSAPSDSRRLPVAPCGGGTAGTVSPSSCGWCSRPTRPFWCGPSPTRGDCASLATLVHGSGKTAHIDTDDVSPLLGEEVLYESLRGFRDFSPLEGPFRRPHTAAQTRRSRSERSGLDPDADREAHKHSKSHCKCRRRLYPT